MYFELERVELMMQKLQKDTSHENLCLIGFSNIIKHSQIAYNF